MSNDKVSKKQTSQVKNDESTQQPQIQYVTMQKSLKGVNGWLVFWIILFVIIAIGSLCTFFISMMVPLTYVTATSLIFAPVLFVGCMASAILIALQKKVAKTVIFATIIISALYSVIGSIASYNLVDNISKDVAESAWNFSYALRSDAGYGSYIANRFSEGKSLPLLICAIMITLIGHALGASYFVLSKRVKQTLVK